MNISPNRYKFGRERDQRRALMKSMADSLILEGSITTTLQKAKAVQSYTERLITKSKIGTLHSRRQIIASLQTNTATKKLIDEIAPLLSGRNSGYLRVTKTKLRRGDGAQMATVSFVDDLTVKPKKIEKKTVTTSKVSKVEKKATSTPKKSSTGSKKIASVKSITKKSTKKDSK
jgi:large subunit ribosomal protein L17